MPDAHLSVLWPLPSGALGATGCWGLPVPGWGRGRMGNAGLCTQWDPLSLYGWGHWQHSPPLTPLFQITKLPDPTEPPQIQGKSRQLL